MPRKNKARNKKKQLSKAVTKQMNKDFNFLNGNSLSLALLGKQQRMTRKAIQRSNVPIAKGFRQFTTAPMIVSSGGKTRVKHTEYVMDVDGTTDFEGTAMAINPGNGMLFPWLSTIAQRFQSYLFNNLKFKYQTTSPTTTAGSVVLAADYDSKSTLPSSKVEALSMESSVRTQPWENVDHTSLKHNLRKRSTYYIRNGTNDPVDSELFDVGNFMVMTEGQPTEMVGGSVGEIHVDYDVDLITPVLTNATGAASSASVLLQATSVASPANFTRPYELQNGKDPSDAPFTIGGTLVSNFTSGGPGGSGTLLDAINFTQPGLYFIEIDLQNTPTGAPLRPLPADLVYWDWLYAQSGDPTIIATREVNAAYDDFVAQPGCIISFVLYVPGSAAPPNGIFASFGFGWNTSGVTIGQIFTKIIITPISPGTNLEPDGYPSHLAEIEAHNPNKRKIKMHNPATPHAVILKNRYAAGPVSLEISELSALESRLTELRLRSNERKANRAVNTFR